MLKWVEPVIWTIMSAMGDLMMFTGLVTLAVGVLFIAYRAAEYKIERNM